MNMFGLGDKVTIKRFSPGTGQESRGYVWSASHYYGRAGEVVDVQYADANNIDAQKQFLIELPDNERVWFLGWQLEKLENL